MKIAFSIPDEIFKKAEKASKKIGFSRSKFYTKAIELYLENLEDENITEALNKIYAHEPSSLDETLSRMQAKSIGYNPW